MRVSTNPSKLACPRCQTDAPSGASPLPLVEVQTPGVTLRGCNRCGGVFLSRACATHLAAQLPSLAIDVSARGSAHATHQPDLTRTLQCPGCRAPMHRTKVSAAGIELDHCPASCGTWYDRDEIKRVTDAIRSSGWGPRRSGPGVGTAVAVGAAAVGVAAVGAVAIDAASRNQGPGAESRSEVAVDLVEGVAEIATEGVVEVAAEGTLTVVGGVFEILGGLFDGF